MPIYEYECTNCGETTEAIQKFSDKPLTKCGACSGKLQKLISQSSFHLKGTGWYVTDYANESKKKKPSESKKSSSTEGTKTETKKSSEKKDNKKSKE